MRLASMRFAARRAYCRRLAPAQLFGQKTNGANTEQHTYGRYNKHELLYVSRCLRNIRIRILQRVGKSMLAAAAQYQIL